MTVSAAYTPAVYTANGTANQFNFGFSALRTQDVWLVEQDKDTGEVVREFQGGSGLTVSLGSGFVIIDDYDQRPLAGNKVTVYRRTQATQTVDLDSTVPVSSDAVEGMSDKLTLLAQEAQNFGDDYTDLQQSIAEALAAQLAAEDARDDAIIAQGDAESARDTAVGAKGDAESARDLAESYRDAAQGYRNAAEGFRDDAAISESNAEAALESLQDLYIGVYADDAAANAAHPTRPVGALYFSSNSDNMRLWNGAAWEVVATPSGDFLLRDGSAPMTGALLAAAGTASAPGVAFDGDPDTGMYLESTNRLSFAAQGTRRLRLDSNGQIAANSYGSNASPTYSFVNDSDTGMYRSDTNNIAFSTDGVLRMRIGTQSIAPEIPLRSADGSAVAPTYSFVNDSDTGMYRSDTNNIAFSTGGVQRMTVASTAVTTTVPVRASDGTAAAPTFSFTSDTNTGIYRTGADTLSIAAGGALAFSASSAGCSFSQGGVTTYTVTTTGLLPNPNNTRSLGAGSNRWTEVFATNGTINTSDAREKTPVSPMTPAEVEAAKDIAREIGTFQWLESVEKKGDAARKHVGLTVQRAIQIMQSHGLDPFAYGFICYDEWDADEMHDAGDIYSFRADQLNLFIARGLEARITALESALL